MQPELDDEKKSAPVLEVHRPTGPRLTVAEKKSLGDLVIHKAKELTESGAKLVITTTSQHKVATTIAASTLLAAATHFIVALLMMSDTRVSVRPYVIGPTSTSFQVPAAAGGCTAATNFLARTSGFSAGDNTRYTDLICNLVSDGVITGDLSGARGCGSKLDLFYVLAAPTQAASQLNLCGTSYPLTANNSPTFSANNGWTGADSDGGVGGKNLDTAFTPSTATSPVYNVDTGHISVWAANDFTGTATGGTAAGFVRGDNSCGTHIFPRYQPDGFVYARIQDQVISSGTAVATAAGFIVGNRTGASASTIYKNASLLASPNVASCNVITGQDAAFKILAGSKGGVNDFGYGGQISAMTLGAQLTAGDISNLCHRINQFLTSANGYASVC
jgi:hypothetical protein